MSKKAVKEYLDRIENIVNSHLEKLLHNPYMSIDLNTNKVKQNDQAPFIIKNMSSKNRVSAINGDLYNDIYDENLKLMQEYNDILDFYIDKEYTTFNELDEDIVDFNRLYDKYYYKGFNANIKNYLDDRVKQEYINKYTNTIATLQVKEINDNLDDIKDFINIDLDNTDIKVFIDLDQLKAIQKKLKKDIKSDDIDDLDIYVYGLIKDLLVLEQVDILDMSIKTHKKYYKDANVLYKKIDKKIIDIVSNFSKYYNDLYKPKKAKAVKNILPSNHTFNLVAPKIFNTTYKMGQYTKIDKDDNLNYDVKLNIVADEINDLRDIIFQEDITNKTLSLLPIDLALFIGFTDLSAINGNNIPINMQDALRYITEKKNLKLKDNKKLLQLYEDRLRTFDKFKVKAIITNKETNKQIRFLDPIAILENARVLDTANSQISYIIGRSAILVILNYLSEQSNKDYLTTFNVANSYINDNQSNTIYTLNMKYYLIIKILQMGNSKDRLNKYNPKINLDTLYEQTALLKGVDELSKTEKARLRTSINKYLEHLISKGLLSEYDYKPLSEGNYNLSKKSDAKDNIYIKI